jgi:hypothetical protein
MESSQWGQRRPGRWRSSRFRESGVSKPEGSQTGERIRAAGPATGDGPSHDPSKETRMSKKEPPRRKSRTRSSILARKAARAKKFRAKAGKPDPTSGPPSLADLTRRSKAAVQEARALAEKSVALHRMQQELQKRHIEAHTKAAGQEPLE